MNVSMASKIYNRNDDEEQDKKLTIEISTQTDMNTSVIKKDYEICCTQLSVTGEIKQIKLNNPLEKSIEEESVDPDQKCPICLGAWTDSGSHRLCALRCGHIFGYKCIKRWLNSDNKLSGQCPQCKAKASIRHIRFLYTNKLSSTDYFQLTRLKRKLKQACYRKLLIKKALIKQKKKTKKYKKMYKASILAVTDSATTNMPFIDLQSNCKNLDV